jgi:energy-coupling factor transport system substrate-specific component
VSLKNRLLKLVSWVGLSLVFGMLLAGVRLSWITYALSASMLLVFLILLEFEEKHADSRMVALVGVLVALTVASRQLLHGIEFSPVFFLVILSGYVFGFTPGFTVGALTMFTSNFFIGHGPWTPFQMLGLGLTGAFAALLPKEGKREMPLLVLYSILTAYLYGFLTDVFSWIAFVPTHTFNSLIAVLGAGMLFNTARAVGNVFFMSILGPVLLRVLRRFRRRLTYHHVNS